MADAVRAARGGRGGSMFLVGESGIGKSRLAAAAVDLGFAADMRLLRGRGSAIGPMVPFRSLTEALLSLLRTGDPIDVARLGPYRPILARLIPDWGEPASTGAGGDPGAGSLVILAEAVLRLTELAGQGRGCLMVLDDLQDADAETLAVVEYLIDNIGDVDGGGTLLLGTIRGEDCPAMALARAAGQRGQGTVVDLGPLRREDLRVLLDCALDGGPVPEPALDLLWAGSAGNPFRLEELLGSVLDSGLLARDPDGRGWRVDERQRGALPAGFVRGVARRVDLLPPRTREVITAAAVLGKRFPLAVVRSITGLDYRELLNLLQGEQVAQLVGPDEQTPDWYAFGHQLIVDAALTLVTPADRARLAAAAADAVGTVYPGLPGEWCQFCAALRLDAGDPAAAGTLFAEAGRRALAQGAAQSAVTLLDKTWELLAHDTAARAAALETQLYALAESGLIDRALDVVTFLDQMGAGLEPRRRARLHTRIAWVAVHASRAADGLSQVAAARALLGPDAAAEDIAPVDVVAAHLELDVPGEDRLRKAEQMARRAAIIAEAVPMPAVACQAWQLLGALTRPRDPAEATALLEHSRALAVRHDLPIWEIHALVRLGHDDALRDAGTERLELAREQASRIGAVTARYQAEVNIALQLILRADFTAARALIDQVLAATTRLRLMETTQYMLLYRAVHAAHQGSRRDMDRALAEFDHWGGDHDQHAARVHGLGRAFCALLEENPALAGEELAHAQRSEERNPTTFHLAGRYGLNVLLRALAGDLDAAGFHEITSAPAGGLRWDRHLAAFGRAVLLGRDGDADGAAAAVADALAVGAPYAMGRHLGLRLVAEAALDDGWGTPVDWLRTAEEYFHGAGVAPVAGACRSLMRRCGVRIGQRREGVSGIPQALRSAGITVREYQVLRLLVDRLGNREIADHLHLSQRTVEKHVSSLITKTGLPNRIALSKFAAGVITPGPV